MCFPPEQGNQTPVRDSPAIPRLRSVNSYTNIRAVNSARNLNKSLQNLNLNEEGEKALLWTLCSSDVQWDQKFGCDSTTCCHQPLKSLG